MCALRQEFYCLHFGAVCRAVPASAVSYEEIDGETMKRNVLFCYDLELPPDFQPQNKGYFLASYFTHAVTTLSPCLCMDVRAATYGSEITFLQELQSLNHVISFVIYILVPQSIP